ncbi:hypothetical protein ABFG93_19335 [Pseudalkalibacillus hwajinpoensis]|uniref:hypothetical protein n=1 Tax=Guptibacillus hwajinpoensis TaxID=208199 RepID=UPI00325BA6A3
MAKKKSASNTRWHNYHNEKGYITATMMLISTLVIGFVLHLCTITENERNFLDREEEELRKESLIVLGMKDTISYIQYQAIPLQNRTFSYQEGTIEAVISRTSEHELIVN